MKRLIISAFLVTALGWAACTDEEESITINGENTIEFTAAKQGAMEDDGLKKTAIVDDIAMFEASDVLTVYGSVGKSVTLSNNSTTQAKTTTFKSMVTAAEYAEFSKSKMYYGALPSTATKDFSDVTEASATISMTLPNSQSPVLNGIDPDAYLLVGATSTNAFTFKSVCAYLKVYVSHPLNSLEITSTGDPLTGDVDVTLKSDNTLSVEVTGNTLNKLTFGALETGYYYIPVLPGKYSLSITAVYTDKVTGTMTAKEKTTTSNSVYNVYLGAGVELPQDILHAYVPKDANSISFLYENLDGYTDVDSIPGTALPTGIHVSSKGDDYVVYTEPKFYILAPEDCSYMFAGFTNKSQYSNIESLDLTNFNTKNVTDMSFMFYFCEKLTSLNISKFNTLKVTTMADMFNDCSALPTIDLSSFNTSNVTDMSSMFEYCETLPTIDVSSFNTSKVTNMFSMFSYCEKMTSLDVSGFDTQNVTNMSYMFYYNSSPTIDVSMFDTHSVTTMKGMFMGSSAASINVSDLDNSQVTDMSVMFSGCKKLTNITFGEFGTESVKTMSCMFQQCKIIESLDLSGFSTSNDTTMCKMFEDCNALKSVEFSSNFITEAVTDMSYMFERCEALETLDLSSFTTPAVTNIFNMFDSCEKLTRIYANTFSVSATLSKEMFVGCTSLAGTDNSESFSYDQNYTTSEYAKVFVYGVTDGYFTDPALKPASSK